MASIIKVETLQDTDGNNSIGMQFVSSGSVKAYISVNQTGTQAINDSFNVASIADNGTGLTGVTYTNNMSVSSHAVTMADNGQSFSGSAGGVNSNGNYPFSGNQKLTTRHGIDARSQTNSVTDKDDASTIVAGDLA